MYQLSTMMPLLQMTKEAESSSGHSLVMPPTVQDQDTLGDTWTTENKLLPLFLQSFCHIKTKLKNLTCSKEQCYITIDSSSGIAPRTSRFISTIGWFILKAQALLMQKTTQRPPLKDQTMTNQRINLRKPYQRKTTKMIQHK